MLSEFAARHASVFELRLLFGAERLIPHICRLLPRAKQIDDEIHAIAERHPIAGAAAGRRIGAAVVNLEKSPSLGRIDGAQIIGKHRVVRSSRDIVSEADVAASR